MQAPTPAWTFEASSYIAVIGTNPENADITNPKGHIYGLAWFVQAWNDYGDTREMAVQARDPQAHATAMAAALNVRMAEGKLPVGFVSWPEGRPIYGSPAYVAYGAADDLAWERREREDEAFGGY